MFLMRKVWLHAKIDEEDKRFLGEWQLANGFETESEALRDLFKTMRLIFQDNLVFLKKLKEVLGCESLSETLNLLLRRLREESLLEV